MNKIMFNDKFLLTKAVLEGRKTQTRRLLTLTLHKKADRGNALIEVSPSKVFFEDGKWKFVYDGYVFLLPKENYPRYNVGEAVAVAQSYKDIYNEKGLETMDMLVQGMKNSKGWTNKMFVAAGMMIHRIRITDVRVEKLQDISDEDCLKEGLEWDAKARKYYAGYVKGTGKKNWLGNTPREAFAHLINKVSRKDVWSENPYVFVYDFELIKKDMEFKSQIATTREQAEQLLALGIKPETADMYWCEDSLLVTDWSQQQAFVDYPPEDKTDEFYPAWSISRLLEMMPLFFRKVIHIQIMPPVVSYWDAGLREFARVYDNSDIYENIISMIAWLISNGYFNTEYLKGETK